MLKTITNDCITYDISPSAQIPAGFHEVKAQKLQKVDKPSEKAQGDKQAAKGEKAS